MIQRVGFSHEAANAIIGSGALKIGHAWPPIS
jgi:hypothetical protein